VLDPCRRRLGSSSSGIGCSFRVLGPPKYRPYCFCDPALPLVPYPGYAVFLWRTAAGDCLGYRPHPLIELDVPLESYPASPTRPPQRSGPLMGFGSLQHSRNPRSTSRGIKPSRYVPPSGFGYPLGGLLPGIPCRFCFTPAALMGFTLRRFPLPRGLAGLSTGSEPTYRCTRQYFCRPKAPDRPDGTRLLGSHLPRVPCDRTGF
jgi:hypothetical protein